MKKDKGRRTGDGGRRTKDGRRRTVDERRKTEDGALSANYELPLNNHDIVHSLMLTTSCTL